MNAPLCPNCREHMSCVEQGLGGVWSCLYCEGTWLHSKQLQAIAGLAERANPGVTHSTPPALATLGETSAQCPACNGKELQEVSVGTLHALSCPCCNGAFFKKGIVAEHAPHLISAAQEAPVGQVLAGILGTVVLLGDPLPLLLALSSKGKQSGNAL